MTDSNDARRRGLVAELRAAAVAQNVELYGLAADEIEHWRRLESEAATYVEMVICMRSGRFTGEPPYVDWKGLGLALEQDYDELKSLRGRLKNARAYAAHRDADVGPDRRAEHLDIVLALLDGVEPARLAEVVEDLSRQDRALAGDLQAAGSPRAARGHSTAGMADASHQRRGASQARRGAPGRVHARSD